MSNYEKLGADAKFDDADKLRAALAAATPGPWMVNGNGVTTRHGFGSRVILSMNARDEQREKDAAYIAACSPDRIARLLDRLEAAERDAERYRWLRDKATSEQWACFAWEDSCPDVDIAIDAAMQSEKQA